VRYPIVHYPYRSLLLMAYITVPYWRLSAHRGLRPAHASIVGYCDVRCSTHQQYIRWSEFVSIFNHLKLPPPKNWQIQ